MTCIVAGDLEAQILNSREIPGLHLRHLPAARALRLCEVPSAPTWATSAVCSEGDSVRMWGSGVRERPKICLQLLAHCWLCIL